FGELGTGGSQLVDDGAELGAHGGDLVFEVHDAFDAREVDTLVLAEPLNLPQSGDIAGGVASAAAGRAGGFDQAQPVVLAQGLRMHPGHFGGGRDGEDLGVEVDFVGGSATVGDLDHGPHS